MNYLFPYTWNNLKGNHAGFPHMCFLLSRKYPKSYTVINELSISKKKYVHNVFINRVINYAIRIFNKIKYESKLNHVLATIKDNDNIFLMEYLQHDVNQIELAKRIKKRNPNIRIYGLVHLTPSAIESDFTKSEILEWTKYINAYLTLGSSLTNYLNRIIENEVPVYTLFHPVDLGYFFPDRVNNHDFSVLTFGNLQRNYETLEIIVRKLPQINFIICAGTANLSHFSKYSNVELYGFLPEKRLRNLLCNSDVSLNILDDTVGSNVITISMAMGLAIVASDVGSIRDYCTEENACLCNNLEDYINAIIKLSNNKSILENMKMKSLLQGKKFSIESLHISLQAVLE